MKKNFFTIGPSQIYDSVPSHIQSALNEDILSISHRGNGFKEIYRHTVNELRMLMNIPASHEVFFLSSGTEAMERTIESLVEKTSFHVVTGAFGERFYKSSRELGNNASKIIINEKNAPLLHSFSLVQEPEIICITQNESSSGFAFPSDTYRYLKKNNPNSLIVLDAVSSAPMMPIEFASVDVALFSVQKCFGLPAGLAVLIISGAALDKARALAHRFVKRITYHAVAELERYGLKYMTPETPNILGIYLLGKVASDMNQKGMETLYKEESEKAKLLYEFFDNSPSYEPHIKNPVYRSQTVIVVAPGSEPAKETVSRLQKKGYIIGSGYGEYKEKHIRIANYPSHTLKQVQSLISLF